ncbi:MULTISPECIES: hypothetical protein [unclassified Rathayibacter]|uniref:hypothetical protein n=1 Tax=unclassified Rathayibacter TaxID=2609250 RepID=UPI0006FCF78A|nr:MULTISPECIES: hypothetical protein [unclassified Rathayibacter]KQQ03618.1 hypothetical protein ASF42_08975 [Rathayibacter sp. Leaf294]KQS12074.1 hypothetical protein ASG06_08975 [Rathayibacter sp. Leaf185]
MEFIVALVGLLGGLLVAIAAVVVVVVGRRRATPASLIDVEVRLSHAGDDWWRVSATVRNLGRFDLDPSAFVDGRPISITLGGAQAAEWYGTDHRVAEWSLASEDTLLLAPCSLPRTVGVGATVVVRGRPEVRIDAPLRYIPVRENVVETQGAGPGPSAAASARPPAPHRVVDAPLEPRPEQESVVRGGFGMFAAMGAGVLGAVLVAVGLVLSLAGSGVTGIGEAGIVLIGTALVGLVGTLTLRLFRRAFEPPALWRTPRQRLMRPGTIIVLVLTYTGLALFCLEFLIQGVAGETTWVAGLGVVLLFAALVGTGLVGFLRLVVLIGVRRASRA